MEEQKSLTDVKTFISKTRKHFHLDSAMVSYKLADLEAKRQELFGDV